MFAPWQIQRRFPDYLTSRRTCDRHLTRLLSLDFLKLVQVRNAHSAWPSFFRIGGRGISHLTRALTNNGLPVPADLMVQRRFESSVVASTSLHDLAVTEFGLAIDRTVRGRPDLAILVGGAVYNHAAPKIPFEHEGQLRAIVPDSAYLMSTQHNDKGPAIHLDCVEIDLATESNPVIYDKLQRYHLGFNAPVGQDYLQRLYDAYGGQEHRWHSWRIIVVVHDPLHAGADQRRLASFIAQAAWLPKDTRNRIHLTTFADLQRSQYDSGPLGHPIWIKLYDCQPWLPEFRTFAKRLESNQRPEEEKRRFVEERLGNLPRHGYFANQPAVDERTIMSVA